MAKKPKTKITHKTFHEHVAERGLPARILWSAKTGHPTMPTATCYMIGRAIVIVHDHPEGGWDLYYREERMRNDDQTFADIVAASEGYVEIDRAEEMAAFKAARERLDVMIGEVKAKLAQMDGDCLRREAQVRVDYTIRAGKLSFRTRASEVFTYLSLSKEALAREHDPVEFMAWIDLNERVECNRRSEGHGTLTLDPSDAMHFRTRWT